MNFQIPTDSLYKFIALSGMLVSLAFYIAPEYLEHIATVTKMGIAAENNLLREDVAFNTIDIAQVKNDIAAAKEAGKHISETTRSLHQQTQTANRANRKLVVQITDKTKLQDYYASQIARVIHIKRRVLIVSIPFMILGFLFWYFKIQRPLDKSLANQNRLK